MGHKHHVVETRDRVYAGPVSVTRQNPAAHGNVVRIEMCTCGAEKRTNINGYHTESSGWVSPEPRENA